MKTPSWKNRALLSGAALVALVASPLARADYQSTVLSQSPVGYWRLNEAVQPQAGSGTATDIGSLGASANGTYNNYPTKALTGPFTGSTAVGLDGVSQSVTAPWLAGINPSAFSFEVWVNPAVVPKFAYVASSIHIASPRSGWYFAQDDGSTFGLGSAFVLRLFNTNTTTPSLTLSAPVTTANTWYHLVITYNGTTAALYTNGVLAQAGTPTANAAGLGFVPNVDGALSLGCRSDINFWWPGQQAEAAMYSGALSAARVAAHYTAATTAPGTYAATVAADAPALYYRFQEAIDPPAANLGTFGTAAKGYYIYDAKAGVGGPTPATFPGFEAANKAAAFDAGGGVVRIPALNLNTNTVTFSCWINATNAQALGAGLVVAGSGANACGLTIDQVNPGLGLGYVWNGNNYGISPSSDFGLPTLPDSQWAFAALVIQPKSATFYICDANNYANFSSIANTFNVNQLPQAFASATLVGAAGGYTTRNFNGAMDEVAIFNRALSAGELYTQYAAAVGGVPPRIFADLQGPATDVSVGDPIVLTIDAGGTPALTYVWNKTGVGPIATNTSGVLTITNAVLGDAGTYDVTISSAYGSAPSSQVLVSVIPAAAPTVTLLQGWQSRTLYPTGTLSMAVSATGGALKYQWFKNSAAIAGATAPAFSIASLKTTDAGSYSIRVTNTLGFYSNTTPVVITVPSYPASSYEGLVIASGPEAWWRLDDATGSTNMLDGMGRHDGHYTNINGTVPPVVLGVTGALNNDTNTAASFSASGGVGVAPYADSLNASLFTVETWVKTTVLNGSLVPVSSTDGTGGFWWQSTSGFWAGFGPPNNYAPIYNYYSAPTIASGQWSHLVAMYNGTRIISGTHYPWVYYVNGQTDGYVWTGADAATAGSFIIGGRGLNTSAFADRFMNGQVDEVAVYQRNLSATEIANHFNGRFGAFTAPYFVGAFLPQTVTMGKSLAYTTTVYGSVPITLQWYKNGTKITGATTTSLSLTNLNLTDTGTYVLWATNSAGTNSQSVSVTVIPPVSYANVTNGTVLHLRFDGDANDSSGRGNNGTPTGSPEYVTGLIGSQALQYTTTTVTNNGTDLAVSTASYVQLGAVPTGPPSDLQFGASTSFSVSLWVKLPGWPYPGDLPFIGTATNSANNPGWVLSPNYDGGGWQWCLGDGSSTIDVNGADDSINDGAWHSFVLTVDRTGAVANSYLDGVLMASRDISSLGSINNNNYWPVTIGQDPTGTYPVIKAAAARDFDAWGAPNTAVLDDVGIWTRPLTAMEVAKITSAGSTGGRSFDTVAPPVTLTVTKSGSSLTLSWATGTLLQSDTLGSTAVWTAVPGASAPAYTFTPTTGNKYYRVYVQ